jgi:hypothetical protein
MDHQRGKLLKTFDRTCTWYRAYLTATFGRVRAGITLAQARENYEHLIPQIPFIGGPKVHMTEDLMESVQVLAILQALKNFQCTPTEMRRILHAGIRARLSQYPRLVRKLAGWRAFSRPFIHNLQRQACQSQTRQYPAGFVYDLVTGDGTDFDWGLNIFECGICKFYAAQGASEFMPLVCSLDYPLSDALGYGLVRTQTLAEGAAYCNPRMKRGRPTQWPIEYT